MPLESGSMGASVQFWFQHLMLGARNFYINQTAKAMFSEESRKEKPELKEYLSLSMGLLSNKEIKQVDKAVITNVKSGELFLKKLEVSSLALKGEEDYVPTLKNIETIIVKGKHTSPLEQPEKVLDMINQLFLQAPAETP